MACSFTRGAPHLMPAVRLAAVEEWASQKGLLACALPGQGISWLAEYVASSRLKALLGC